MARASTQLKETFDTGAQLPSEPVSGTSVVTVYCRHGAGIVLRAGKMVPMSEPSPNGMREIPGGVFKEIGRFRVAGPARPVGADPRVITVAGYAVTHGVPKDLWDAWYEANKNSDLVRNKIIFAHESESHGNGEAHELRDTATGLEPLSKDKDPRTKAITRRLSAMTGVDGVEPLVR